MYVCLYVFHNVVCCCCDWHIKGQPGTEEDFIVNMGRFNLLTLKKRKNLTFSTLNLNIGKQYFLLYFFSHKKDINSD